MFSSYKFDAINTKIASISPGAEHFFGTDTYGRDLFVRVWTGTRYSLFIAVVAIFIDVIVGMTYGLISGYFGGKVDSVMQENSRNHKLYPNFSNINIVINGDESIIIHNYHGFIIY